MLMYFKKTKWLYWISWAACFAGCGLFLFPMRWVWTDGSYSYTRGLWIFQHTAENDSFSLWMSATLLIGVSVTVALMLHAQKLYKGILNILHEDCNPQEYLRQHEPLLKRGRRNSATKALILSNYAAGLDAAGNLEDAIRFCEQAISFPLKKRFEIHLVVFYYNLSVFYAHDAYNLEKSRELLETAKAILRNNLKSKQYDACRAFLYNQENILMFYAGDYETPLAYFLNALSLAKNRHEAVCIHYTLARIYEKRGETALQKEHLLFVAEQGNTLKIAADARETLSALS